MPYLRTAVSIHCAGFIPHRTPLRKVKRIHRWIRMAVVRFPNTTASIHRITPRLARLSPTPSCPRKKVRLRCLTAIRRRQWCRALTVQLIDEPAFTRRRLGCSKGTSTSTTARTLNLSRTLTRHRTCALAVPQHFVERQTVILSLYTSMSTSVQPNHCHDHK